MKRHRGVFRASAVAAKERLGSGFWVDAISARKTSVEHAQNSGKSGEEVLNLFIKQLKQQVSNVNNYDEANEQLYRRVRAVLLNTPNSNPLASILDRDYMRELCDTERERYVFTLSEQVHRCVERFEQELEFAQIKTANSL